MSGILAVAAVFLFAARPAPAAEAAGPTSLTVTPWQVFRTPTYVANPQPTVQVHGDVGEYAGAPAIPADNASGWQNCGSSAPVCPDANTIDMHLGSRLPGCWVNLDFTYFQSFVSIPANSTISQFSIVMNGADDGARVTIINSHYPGGLVVSGSYIFLGPSQSTSDLSQYVVAGEVNRVVITQVDDCAVGNNLNYAAISLNGSVVVPADPSDITYTGDTQILAGTTAHLAATLVDTLTASPAPAGLPVAFTLNNGGGSCSGTTDAAGTASCNLSGVPAGTYTVTAAYAGSALLSATSTSATLLVYAAPTIALQSISPAPNGAGWNNTAPVTVTWTCTDSTTPTVSASLSSEGANQSVTGTCTGAYDASLTASDTQTVSIDTVPPTVTATASPAPNGGGWNNTPVTVTFAAAADGGSPITCDAPVVVSTDGAGQLVTGTCTDAASNTGTASVTLDVDTTPPALSPTVTPNPVVLNGTATADPGASDALSGVATSSCDPVTATAVGSYTVNCTATDVAGNTATASASYDVGYAVCTPKDHDDHHGDIEGHGDDPRHHDPRHADAHDPKTGGYESGSTIPVRISLCDANGVNVSSRSITVTAVSLSPTGTLNDSGHANPGNLFRFDDHGYIFNLSTKGLAAGDYTLDFTVAGDPTVHGYAFTIKADHSRSDDHGSGGGH